MMVGPAAVTHIADLHLDVLVDAGAALVVLSRSLSLRLSLFISKQATNFLTPANAIQTFSYGVLFLFQKFFALSHDLLSVNLNLVQVYLNSFTFPFFVVFNVVLLTHAGGLKLFAFAVRFLFEILLLFAGKSIFLGYRGSGSFLFLYRCCSTRNFCDKLLDVFRIHEHFCGGELSGILDLRNFIFSQPYNHVLRFKISVNDFTLAVHVIKTY